jgi:hypothetical protein
VVPDRNEALRLSGIAPGDYDRFEFDQDEDGYHLDEACLGGFASKAACPAFRVRR